MAAGMSDRNLQRRNLTINGEVPSWWVEEPNGERQAAYRPVRGHCEQLERLLKPGKTTLLAQGKWKQIPGPPVWRLGDGLTTRP